jgi:N-acetylmuramic acid 6-phosphate etherase
LSATLILYPGGVMSAAISNIQASLAKQAAPIHIDDPYLATLPAGFMLFEEFEKEFALGSATTEQLHPTTRQLSQIMHKNIPSGMELLLKVDENVVQGLEAFIPSIRSFAPSIADKIRKGGRVFLVGSGSSGRVGIDIAAKCSIKFPKVKEQIQGVIAGGDSALIRAKEGFEDSEADGEEALKDYNLGPKDTVILISASGSASFNVGCGHLCANRGAGVFYFYNSKNIPWRTQRLFERNFNPIIPLCIDIGPQAIGGSTRLQGATLAESCLGALLGSTLYLTQGEEVLAKGYPMELVLNMQKGLALIKDHLGLIRRFPQMEAEVFSSPRSNFRQSKDVPSQGYVTFVSLEDSMREVLIDSTETSPTFSTNPMRRENEIHKERAEFRAYLLGQGDNAHAWTALLGRDVHPCDSKDTESFLLAGEEDGINSFSKRPLDKGNCVIGVAKIKESGSIPQPLIQVLESVKKQEGSTGLILICTGRLSEEQVKELGDVYDCALIMENTPSDSMGFTETIILKQVLNLISNSSMVLMNKVHGNQMIDVRASNKKLIDRCIRLIKDIWREYQPDRNVDDKLLYHYVAHVSAIKKSNEEEGIYTPSVVKIVLAMLALKKTPDNFQDVIEFLGEKQERIDWIEDEQ